MYKYFELLKKYAKSEESFLIVMKHSLEVLEKSINIVGKRALYDKADFDLIISGSILHDIGTFEFLENLDDNIKNKDYIKHGIMGAEILRKEGLEREALIAERHIGSGLSKEEIIANGFPLPHEDFLPVSLEEKIVCYADKFSSKKPNKKDTLETIEREFAGYGKYPLKRFLELEKMFG